MKIFSILKIIINPKLIGYIISKVYIRWYEKFSYNFKINGEEHLLKSLPHEEIKVMSGAWAAAGYDEADFPPIYLYHEPWCRGGAPADAASYVFSGYTIEE